MHYRTPVLVLLSQRQKPNVIGLGAIETLLKRRGLFLMKWPSETFQNLL